MKHNVETIKIKYDMLVRYASKRNFILNATRVHQLGAEIEGFEKELKELYEDHKKNYHWTGIELKELLEQILGVEAKATQ